MAPGVNFGSSTKDHHKYGSSVTWPISINNKMFFVGQNLYDVLHDMPEYPMSHWRFEDGRTVLHDAAGGGIGPSVWMLLQQRAQPNCTDNTGKTALHHAVLFGNLEVVELLVNAGAITISWTIRERWKLIMPRKMETIRSYR